MQSEPLYSTGINGAIYYFDLLLHNCRVLSRRPSLHVTWIRPIIMYICFKLFWIYRAIFGKCPWPFQRISLISELTERLFLFSCSHQEEKTSPARDESYIRCTALESALWNHITPKLWPRAARMLRMNTMELQQRLKATPCCFIQVLPQQTALLPPCKTRSQPRLSCTAFVLWRNLREILLCSTNQSCFPAAPPAASASDCQKEVTC